MGRTDMFVFAEGGELTGSGFGIANRLRVNCIVILVSVRVLPVFNSWPVLS